jgi:hypothetical protein
MQYLFGTRAARLPLTPKGATPQTLETQMPRYPFGMRGDNCASFNNRGPHGSDYSAPVSVWIYVV